MHQIVRPVRKRIGFLGYDGIMALDLVGPMDAFANAPGGDDPDATVGGYEIVILALESRPFTSESGLVMHPNASLHHPPELDTLIIPGGCGLRRPKVMREVVPAIRKLAERTRRVATVCTGIYALAETGLLDGRRVATHWRFTEALARQYPALRVDADALFVKDGKFYSSAGITAGIDLALALIEEDYGPRAALAVARELVVYLKRSGGQDQFSEPLKFQTSAANRFAHLAGWIVGHLDQDLSIEALSRRVFMSPRHFGRLFKQSFGRTPAVYAEDLRLSEARHRLTEGNATIAHLAESLGYQSDDAFRRAFERRFRLSPAAYRARFGFRAFRLERRTARPRHSPKPGAPKFRHSNPKHP
jgi:transcriptional regulator GlxA family with amidase domain